MISITSRQSTRFLTNFNPKRNPLINSTSSLGSSQQIILINRRQLSIHEHMSMSMMKMDYGIPVPEAKVAYSASEAVEVAKQLNSSDLVVKAQVLAGGRGKGRFPESGLQGGVHLITTDKDQKEVHDLVGKMIGNKLVTKQTGEQGRICQAVYVAERKWVRSEFYFALLMDRETQGPMVVCSSKGGMDIEKVASEDPSAIIKLPIDITQGLQLEQANELAVKLGFTPQARAKAADMMLRLYRMFLERDCTMVEINPMAETNQSEPICMDAKLQFDDNAEFRQASLFKLRDTEQEDPREVQASKFDLNYIGLDGEIGCLVNGAGLAMATLDLLKLHGGAANNFLDVGGGAQTDQVLQAFKILQADPRVTAILVNIFGGIMRCDVIADGIIKAYRELTASTNNSSSTSNQLPMPPLVIRLQGTNVKQAREMIEKELEQTPNAKIYIQENLDMAAEMAVKMSHLIKQARSLGFDDLKFMTNKAE